MYAYAYLPTYLYDK
jgi:hypothetical protein